MSSGHLTHTPHVLLSRKTEWVWLTVLLLGMTAIAGYCAPYLVGWIDEVQFADPAYSLYLNQGFTSSAWPYQRPDEFFIGNAPLFSFMLSMWMHIVGTDIVALHAMNWGLAAIGVGLVWMAWVRVHPEISTFVRILIVFTLFTGYGMTFSYFSLRYDILGFALLALVFYSSTLHGRLREYLLGVSGFLTILAGFHLVVAVCIAIAGLVLLCRNTVKQWLSLFSGIVAGGMVWLAIVASQGLLKKFFLVTFGSQHVISGQLGQFVNQGDRGLLHKLQRPLQIYSEDPSLLIMMLCFVVGYVLIAKVPDALRAVSVSGRLFLILTLLMPLGLFVIGKFPVYYTWLAFVPCCLLCGEIWDALIKARGKVFALGLVAFCVVSVGVGTVSIVNTLLTKSSRADVLTSPEFKTQLRRDDWAYASFAAYFAIRPWVERVVVPTYGQTIFVPGIPEKDRISVVLVSREEFAKTIAMLGGTWSQLPFGQPFTPRSQNWVLARRVT